MTKYKKGIRTFSVLFALVCFLSMASFTTYKSCKIANVNTLFIKEQIQLAIDASDFEKSKYYTFKALKAMHATKKNFEDCGCDNASKQLHLAEQNLKNMVRSKGMEDAKIFLDIGIKTMNICLDVLEQYDENQAKSSYDDNLLVINTIQDSNTDPGIWHSENSALWETVQPSLDKLRASLDAVTKTVECQEAREFMKNMKRENKQKLKNPELSQLRSYYFRSVDNIIENALLKVEGCK